MNYSDLFNTWINAREQEPNVPLNRVNESNMAPVNWLNPESISQLLQSYSPFDLYLNPSQIPVAPPTVALTTKDFIDPGFFNNILMVNSNPRDNFNQLRGPESYFSLYPNLMSAGLNAPQQIYNHELGHALDYRLLPFLNKGFMLKNGFPNYTPLQAIENPAWLAEYGMVGEKKKQNLKKQNGGE